jgi:hypothetical protein
MLSTTLIVIKWLYSKRLLLLRFLTLKIEVDYNGRCETPVGIAGRLRPRRSDSDEEAQLTPQGKGATWSCNQPTHSKIATMFKKTAYIIV